MKNKPWILLLAWCVFGSCIRALPHSTVLNNPSSVPNQVAAEMCLRHGWAFSLAAAWMRCKLKGELLPESAAPRSNKRITANKPTEGKTK